MHQIPPKTIHFENNNLRTYTEKTMKTLNPTPSITETIITPVTKIIHTESTKNPHYNFSLAVSTFHNQTGRERECNKTVSSDKENPCNRNGVQLTCLVCKSIYHFAQNCPEAKSQDTFFSQEIILFKADYHRPTQLRNLFLETRNATILDSGAINTVTGKPRMDTYIDTLVW